ncbi:AMP-binding protein [Nakamurella leprariae]|uniref:AMP-binding protein n=1 Tax=Nakamurella leprariae TaxID=2803911 RepID=A0A938YGT6_9ACTN|nr:AMP-binding protein [Nakamurella leprariae]MBM9469639.1 AMP-binding protein [Nakamurella leprariae]
MESLVAALGAGFGDDVSRGALVDDLGATLSWRMVAHAAAGFAETLRRTTGPVGVLGTTGVEFLTVMIAAATTDRPVCALHHDWSETELVAALADAGIGDVVTHRGALPSGVRVVRPPVVDVPDAAAADLSADAVESSDALFFIGFTSGSSGRPKPFARRQSSWTSSFAAAADLFGVCREVEVVLPGHLQHSHFLFGAMLGWSQGAPLRVYERFDPIRLAADLADVRAGVLYLVPTMITALHGAGIPPLGRVRTVVVSGAKLEPHHLAAAARLFPQARIFELYGASETSFITVNRHGPVAEDPGCVGLPFPGVELDIRPRPDDEPGHGLVYVRSRYLFEGYLEAGALVAGIPADGFITVGDVGSIRSDGALSLRGRASNLVITGGKNVHPEEIEIALSDHPDLAGSAVVGVPHPYWGEELVACVVPAPGVGFDAEDVSAFLRPRVAGYKIPKRWIVVEDLPRTATGKTDRSGVRILAGS